MEGGNEKQLFSFIILLLVILITISYGFPHIYCMILSIHPLKTSLFKPLQQSESATITIFFKDNPGTEQFSGRDLQRSLVQLPDHCGANQKSKAY